MLLKEDEKQDKFSIQKCLSDRNLFNINISDTNINIRGIKEKYIDLISKENKDFAKAFSSTQLFADHIEYINNKNNNN